MSAPSYDTVREALTEADEAAAPYVSKYTGVEAVEWPNNDDDLEAEARTILAELQSQLDSILYEASEVDREDVETIKEAMPYLKALVNDKPVDDYLD